MHNQAAKRGGGRDDGQFDGHDDFARDADGYTLRGGHHYGQAQDGYDDQPYDPRAYAPNPDEPYGYDQDGNPLFYEYEAEPRKLKSNRGGVVLIAAVLGLALVGGAGAFAYKMIGGSSSGGDAPLIKAETEPVKTVPKDAAKEAEHQNKAIYDRVDPVAPPKSKVVSREEQPVDLPASPSSEPRADGARIILPGGPAAAAAQQPAPGTAGSEPRRVKTTTIRPDASLSAAQEPTAPTARAVAPADPIAEAARTGETPRSSEFDNGIMAEDAGRRAVAAQRQAAALAPRPAPPPAAVQAAPRPAPQPVIQPAARPTPPAPAPAPVQRSEPQQQVAAVAPRAPAPAAQPRAATGGFVVQVTSQRSEQDARTAYSNLQRRFPQVLGSYQASIQSATVAERGTYFRARVGPFANSADASTVCNNLRAAGGDCVVARN